MLVESAEKKVTAAMAAVDLLQVGPVYFSHS